MKILAALRRTVFSKSAWVQDDPSAPQDQLSRLDWWDRYPHLAPRSANDLARVDIKRIAKFLTSAPIADVEAVRDNQEIIYLSSLTSSVHAVE